jgi:NADH-quinone oxidoreductase subunit E
MGEEALRAHLKRRLGIDFGQTTPDSGYTLLPVACLGACEHAPVLLLDRERHDDLTEKKIDVLLGRRG